MDPQSALSQQHRPRLFGLAYRMLGTPTDAEDVLHDAWLRWHAQVAGGQPARGRHQGTHHHIAQHRRGGRPQRLRQTHDNE